MSLFNSVQAAVVDQDNRNMARAGYSMSQTLNDMQDDIDSGSIGITSQAPDVDSLCLGGGAFGYDPSLTSGLNFGYRSGRCLAGRTVLSVTSGTVLLNASATNYVELNPSGAGSISSNVSGFTAGRVPLYIVVTGPSSISSVTNAKVLLWAPASGAIAGVQLSQAAASKSMQLNLGTITATASFLIFAPVASSLEGAYFGVQTTLATDAANYWTFSLTEAGSTGTNITAMLDTGADNSSNSMGGSACTANAARSLVLNTNSANLTMAANDTLIFTATKSASGSNLVGASLRLDFLFTN